MVSTSGRLPLSEQRLLAMRDALVHRGPDDAGHYLAPGVALGSRRLAILDLSKRGHMPMSTPDGRYQIVYNGEAYNYRSLRPALEARGCTFHSDSDTEVVLNLYVAEGPAMLERLNGMFALAIWDSLERRLFLARDRLGVKPLYYAQRGDSLFFASEEKSLFAAGMPARFDSNTWEELLCFRFVTGEATPFAGVQRLLPGHHLTWQDGRVEIRRWWKLSERARALADRPPADAVRWFRETFDDSVALRRISDVPVGVLLSGGLDSSNVAASLGHQGAVGAACFTMRFAERDYDEGPLARQVAERWGLKFFDRVLPTDELLDRLRRASWYNDEPLVHGNDAHLWTISELAKPHVTVLLSGEGADETLGGYVRYQPLRWPRWLALGRAALPLWRRAVRPAGRAGKLARFLALGELDRFVLYNSCDVLPDDLTAIGMQPTAQFRYREAMLDEASSLYPGEPVRQVMYSDQHTFLCSLLDRNDRMTMAASIECRVPFLDYRLVEQLAALPTRAFLRGRRGKYLARAALGSRLPDAILKHRKWGFGVPWNRYFREDRQFRAELEALPNAPIVRDGPFDRGKLRGVIRDFLSGDDRHYLLMRQLFLTCLWHEAYFPRAGATARAESPTLPTTVPAEPGGAIQPAADGTL